MHYDPLPVLLSSRNKAIVYFSRRDLLGEKTGPATSLWELPVAAALIRRQKPDGSWSYPARGTIRSETQYDQIETYRNLGFLVEKFGMNRKHAAIRDAARFLFSCQTAAGDFRGIYGNQYSPNYTAGIMELLIKAGYGDDPRIRIGFKWLLSVRQDNGGWAIPLRTRGAVYSAVLHDKTLEPDGSRPFSHMVTGVVLRAFAAHSRYKRTAAAKKGALLLSSRFFQKDRYTDRSAPEFWERCSFPFWFTDIISALDSLSRIGMPADRPEVALALRWLTERQKRNGVFDLKLLKTKDKDLELWLCLAVCRILKRFFGKTWMRAD